MNVVKKKLNDRVWYVYVSICILSAFFSFNVYPFWHVRKEPFNIVCGLIMLLYILICRNYFRFSIQTISFCILFFFAYIYRLHGNLNLYLYSFLVVLPVFSVLLLKDRFRVSLLNSFQSVFSLIIVISSLGWLLYLLGFPLYHFFDYCGHKDGSYQYIFDNYLLFVVNVGTEGEKLRFPSIFLEPGYFSIILVFLLFINHFDFTTIKNKFYLLGLILSLSLAGYIFFFLTYLANNIIERNRKMTYRILIVFTILSFSYFFAISYNNGNNVLNEKIITRLLWDDEKNNIAGYNRTSESFDIVFDNFLKSDNIWFGIDSYDYSLTNVGYKPYIMQYGFFGFFLLILSMFFVYYNRKKSKNLVLFLLFFLTFARGHYVVFYFGFWLLYCCGISVFWEKRLSK